MGTVNIISSGKNVNRNQNNANRTEGAVQELVFNLNRNASARIPKLNTRALIFKNGSNSNNVYALLFGYACTNK